MRLSILLPYKAQQSDPRMVTPAAKERLEVELGCMEPQGWLIKEGSQGCRDKGLCIDAEQTPDLVAALG